MMNVMACGRAFKTRISACYTPERHFCRSFFYRTFALPYFYRVYDNRNSANRNIVFQLYGKQVKIIKPLPLKLF